MEQVLLIIGVVVVAWIVVATVVALGLGRAVRLADQRQQAQLAYRRAAARPAARPTRARVPARAS